MSMRSIQLPLDQPVLSELRVGQWVSLNGILITARDAALQKVNDHISEGKQPPVNFKSQLIYFVGPTPPAKGEPIGSAGPTTSKRMEQYMSALLDAGICAVMGKGPLTQGTIADMKRHGAIYLAAVGGAGAYYGSKIKGATVLAYEDLGPEAIYSLNVESFPAVVAVDLYGGDLFAEGPKKFMK